MCAKMERKAQKLSESPGVVIYEHPQQFRSGKGSLHEVIIAETNENISAYCKR